MSAAGVSAGPAAHRLGQPSPLIFHLTVALAAYQQALLAAPNATDPRFPWPPHLREAARELAPGLDRFAVAREIGRRLTAIVEGIEAWQAHPYRRTLAAPPALWSAGSSRLLDYGQTPEARVPDGPPVLVVPSLINRAYILDLMPERSLLRWLAAEGFRPVLLDWGEPGRAEAGFDLDAYGALRLLPALAHLGTATGRRVGVIGYCMGGTLATGLAARAPEHLAALVAIGAPWDFSPCQGTAGALRAMVRADGPQPLAERIATLGETFGALPVAFFQLLFALVNPMQVAVKFQRFARLDPASAAAHHFVALEDWLADGVPMAWRAAHDLFVGWHIENRPARGAWRFLGGPVRPETIRLPSLVICGQSDSIAPPALALPLTARLAAAQVIAPPTGHVGMIVGSAARAQVWRPLAAFLRHHLPQEGAPPPPAGAAARHLG